MTIDTNYFITRKTARYSTWGEISEETKYVWFVLHGSKMTCEQMLYKFSDFDPKSHFVIAPEGLNRFYLNGFGGDVVASWMTKRDRLTEITDFCEYLSGLYQKYMDISPKTCKKIILGFSQGGTTMYRWLKEKEVKADVLLPYSCWIPEDINLQDSKTDLQQIHSIYTYGTNDPFLTKETVAKVIEVIKKNKLQLSMEAYDGDHRVDRAQLMRLFEKYFKK